MPATYTIHRDLGLVVTRYTGSVSGDELVDLYRTMLADPTYEFGMDELADLVDMKEFALTSTQMREVDALTRKAYEGTGETFRTAICSSGDLGYGIGRMYEVFALDGPESVGVFRSVREGLDWLGVEKEAAERLLSELS